MNYQGTDFLEFIKYTSQQNPGLMFASSGHVTSVDPNTYTAKVMLEPYAVETGWIPICSVYAGNGYGLIALPEIGTDVTVIFEMGDIQSGKIVSVHHTKVTVPSGIVAGEAYLIHKSGSCFKLHNDGNVELNAQALLKLNGGGAAVARVGDAVQIDVPGIGVCTGTITSGSSKVQSG